jgi:hypothetical protein
MPFTPYNHVICTFVTAGGGNRLSMCRSVDLGAVEAPSIFWKKFAVDLMPLHTLAICIS